MVMSWSPHDLALCSHMQQKRAVQQPGASASKAELFLSPFLVRSIPQSRHAAAIHGEDPLDLYCGPYPAVQVPPPQGDSAFTMIEVGLTEMAYYVVSKHFHASLPEDQALILAIYRVRNDHLWQAYMR